MKGRTPTLKPHASLLLWGCGVGFLIAGCFANSLVLINLGLALVFVMGIVQIYKLLF